MEWGKQRSQVLPGLVCWSHSDMCAHVAVPEAPQEHLGMRGLEATRLQMQLLKEFSQEEN